MRIKPLQVAIAAVSFSTVLGVGPLAVALWSHAHPSEVPASGMAQGVTAPAFASVHGYVTRAGLPPGYLGVAGSPEEAQRGVSLVVIDRDAAPAEVRDAAPGAPVVLTGRMNPIEPKVFGLHTPGRRLPFLMEVGAGVRGAQWARAFGVLAIAGVFVLASRAGRAATVDGDPGVLRPSLA